MTSSYIALFRGINVGGKNILPMKALVKFLEESGYVHIKTYIQSGNVVFQSPPIHAKEFTANLGEKIRKNYGFNPGIILLSAEELKKAIHKNPFREAEKQPKSLHLFFLEHMPKNPDLEALNQIMSSTESFKLVHKVFYLYAPDGIGRSKLAMQVEKKIGVLATARNWNTVTKLLEIVNIIQ